MTSDPIGLDGGLNTFGYVGGNPVGWIDPKGLETAVVVGGATSTNPFGHVAISFTGKGVYSFGTGTLRGSSFTDYLSAQASYRNSTVYILNTTAEQEALMLAELQRYESKSLPNPFKDLIGAIEDTCATRTQSALEAGGIVSPLLPFHSPFPVDTAALAMLNGATQTSIPQGGHIPDEFSKFNP